MEKIIADWNKNAEKNHEENYLFIRSLKFKDEKKADRRAKEFHEEAFAKIDCLKCGNCCKTSSPVLLKEDINRIADFLKITPNEVKSTYLKPDGSKSWTPNALPCPFLGEENECKIYEARPDDCQEFPHTNKSGFASRSHGHAWNSTICPATFYIVERMKEASRFR